MLANFLNWGQQGDCERIFEKNFKFMLWIFQIIYKEYCPEVNFKAQIWIKIKYHSKIIFLI